MRYRCLLLVLLLSIPAAAWARTSPVTVGKTTGKLTPQQVQFMRWWRAQTHTAVKPTAEPVTKPVAKPVAKPVTRPITTTTTPTLTIAPRASKGRSVTVVRIPSNTSQRVQAPVHRTSRLVTARGSSVPSLTLLKAVLVKTQTSPVAAFAGAVSPKLTVVRVKRRGVRRTTRGDEGRDEKRRRPRTSVQHAANKLVVVQSSSSSDPPPQPSTLTTLRYQLELSQME